ncbi:uncharacterized protein JCM6883_003185 [Sporobolomyces salmoneus]|uniref:uncharacterized protein n=1 Tax=Sporobolomyces salmoneus TaxID=183962 RepID=UPI00316DEC3E
MRFSFTFASVIATSLVTLALAAQPDEVFNDDSAHTLLAWYPPITRPSGGEVFEAGSTQVASWNRELPTGYNLTQVGKYADLLLGYSLPDVLNYHLDVTLVKNISIYEGDAEVEYTLPADLPTRDSYFLALVGSSSNISPAFTIQGLDGTPAAENEGEGSGNSENTEEEDEKSLKRWLKKRSSRRS